MGRLDFAFLFVCGAGGIQRALVLVRLFTRVRRDVEGSVADGRPIFRFLAVVAKKMDFRVAIAVRFYNNSGGHRFSMAGANSSGTHCGDRGSGGGISCYRRFKWQDAGPSIAGFTAISAFLPVRSPAGVSCYRLVSLRQRALSISVHRLLLICHRCWPNPAGRLKPWSHDFGARYIAITPQWLLRGVYLCLLALCACCVARLAQNRDRRALILIAAPWLIMFALLGQMHERYLVWGAVVSAVALGVSVRLSVLHFIISLLSTAMIFHVMLIDRKLDATMGVIEWLSAIRPYASWLVLICVAIWLWDAIAPAALFQRRKQLQVGTIVLARDCAEEA
jgi:hypothetical protein